MMGFVVVYQRDVRRTVREHLAVQFQALTFLLNLTTSI